jgi:hypothetical protein
MSANDVNIAGLLKTFLCSGLTPEDAICEFIDNAIKALATRISIKLLDGVLYIGDNGSGMDKEQLKNAFVIGEHDCDIHQNGRDTDIGAFGMGIKLGASILTKNQQTITVFSCKPGARTVQLDMNYPEIVKTGNYVNSPGGLTVDDQPRWRRHGVDDTRGTLFCINCDPEIYKKLIVMFKPEIPSELSTNFLYKLGWTYGKFMETTTFEIIVDEITNILVPIDPLEWEKTSESNKCSTRLDVFVKGEDLRLYFKNIETGEDGFILNKNEFIPCRKEYLQKNGFELIEGAQVEHKSSYNSHEDWIQHQKSIHPQFEIPECKKIKRSSQRLIGGRFYTRGKKRIFQAIAYKPSSGDFYKREIHFQSRHELIYNNLLDTQVGTLVNKSRLNEKSMHKAITLTRQYLAEKFIEKMCYQYPPPNKLPRQPTTSDASASDAAICEQHAHDSDDDTVIDESIVQEDTEPPIRITLEIHEPTPVETIHDPTPKPIKTIRKTKKTTTTVPVKIPTPLALEPEFTEVPTTCIDKPEAVILKVGNYLQKTISIAFGINCLHELFESSKEEQVKNAFTEFLGKMILEYQSNCAPNEAKKFLKFMAFEAQFAMVNELIEEKYGKGSQEKDILYGSELHTFHSSVFQQEP